MFILLNLFSQFIGLGQRKDAFLRAKETGEKFNLNIQINK